VTGTWTITGVTTFNGKVAEYFSHKGSRLHWQRRDSSQTASATFRDLESSAPVWCAWGTWHRPSHTGQEMEIVDVGGEIRNL